MTTIAVKGDQMSCDGLTIGGYNRKETDAVKILRHKGELWGFAGNVHTHEEWIKWIDTRADPLTDPPMATMFKETDAIRLNKKGITVFNKDEEFKEEIKTPFMSIGSGSCFAIGALEFGASSAEAVQIACSYDKGSSGLISTFSLGDE